MLLAFSRRQGEGFRKLDSLLPRFSVGGNGGWWAETDTNNEWNTVFYRQKKNISSGSANELRTLAEVQLSQAKCMNSSFLHARWMHAPATPER